MRAKLSFIWTALLGFFVLLSTVPARAQECAVGEVGPFSLIAAQDVRVCATNLYGIREMRVALRRSMLSTLVRRSTCSLSS